MTRRALFAALAAMPAMKAQSLPAPAIEWAYMQAPREGIAVRVTGSCDTEAAVIAVKYCCLNGTIREAVAAVPMSRADGGNSGVCQIRTDGPATVLEVRVRLQVVEHEMVVRY